jgi:hypothetical protein
MIEPRQKIMLALGEGGCYFLCLIRLAESLHSDYRIDAVPTYLQAIKDKNLQEDCTVLNPAGIMQTLYGGRWYYHKEGISYKCGPGEFEILRYERPTPAKVFSHFVLGNCNGGIEYDPLGESHTVANGYLVSKRILQLVIGNA